MQDEEESLTEVDFSKAKKEDETEESKEDKLLHDVHIIMMGQELKQKQDAGLSKTSHTIIDFDTVLRKKLILAQNSYSAAVSQKSNISSTVN